MTPARAGIASSTPCGGWGYAGSMTLLSERLGTELPILQAGRGGGIARHELAAAVSEAGGLGTVAILEPAELERELESARRLTGKPIAVNLLLPFATRAHWDVAARADVVITFWGSPRRRTDRAWLHQCGSVAEAIAPHRAGADGAVVPGINAGEVGGAERRRLGDLGDDHRRAEDVGLELHQPPVRHGAAVGLQDLEALA